jgi:hypothetical protein
MASSTEDIALKVLAALQAEQDRAQTLLQCRPYEDILREVAQQHRFTAEEMRSADRYLKTNHLIKGAQRQDGFAALPSPQGIAYLNSHAASVTAEKKSGLETRQRWYVIVISLVAVAIALFGSRACSH